MLNKESLDNKIQKIVSSGAGVGPGFSVYRRVLFLLADSFELKDISKISEHVFFESYNKIIDKLDEEYDNDKDAKNAIMDFKQLLTLLDSDTIMKSEKKFNLKSRSRWPRHQKILQGVAQEFIEKKNRLNPKKRGNDSKNKKINDNKIKEANTNNNNAVANIVPVGMPNMPLNMMMPSGISAFNSKYNDYYIQQLMNNAMIANSGNYANTNSYINPVNYNYTNYTNFTNSNNSANSNYTNQANLPCFSQSKKRNQQQLNGINDQGAPAAKKLRYTQHS